MTEPNSITFQLCDVRAFDHDFDIEDDDDDSSTPSKKYLIKLFGVTENGHSVSVNVKDYTPFFYLKITHEVNRQTSGMLYDFINSKLPYFLRSSLLDVTIVQKKDFWGFQNNKQHYFARLKFANLAGFRNAARLFSQKVTILSISRTPIKYQIYESNIDPFLRMFHIRGIEPCGWVTIKNVEKTRDLLPTLCKINLDCHWSAIFKHNVEKIAPLTVASFDIECTSSHGDFPVARKNYKKTAYELMQLFAANKYSDNIKDRVREELVKVFNQEEPGSLSKVYVKKPGVCDYNALLHKHIDDIFTILNGKLSYKGDHPVNERDKIMSQLISKFGDYEQDEWGGIFPPIEGDPIIQIGTTVHRYGETKCFYKSIITLGTCDPIDGVDITECETEDELLIKWRDLILNIDPDIVTGYNIFGFDLSYIWERSKELRIADEVSMLGRIADKKCAYVEKELSSSALGDNLLKFIDMDGRVLIDIMKVVQRDHKLDSFKLDNVANHFMNMNKHDIHPNDIFRLQKGDSKDRSVIADYCVQDCTLCNHLAIKLEILANNIGMANVCQVPLSYIFMRGQGIKIFSLVAKECRSDDLLIPTVSKVQWGTNSDEGDEEGYEGAIVLDPKEKIYIKDPVSVLDYASLYPSSMISENLSHDKIVLDPKYDNLPGLKYNSITYDVYEKINDKKVKTSERVVKFVEGEVGAIPKILMKLLKSRKETRKKMEFKDVYDIAGNKFTGLVKQFENGAVEVTDLQNEKIIVAAPMKIADTYDDFQKAVLDGLQVAYKVTANSLYGQCGARTSPIYLKDIAACTTATGRKMILMAKQFLEDSYAAEIVYGDSVTGYTPVIVRHAGIVKLETIERLADKYGTSWELYDGKEYSELTGVESWTEEGWTPIYRVMRHELAKHKKIIRVNTSSGIVDVTDDHSLLTSTGVEISPKDIDVGSHLLHHPMPKINTTLIDVHSDNEARVMGFFCGDGKIEGNVMWSLVNKNLEKLRQYKTICETAYPHFEWKIINTIKISGEYRLIPCTKNIGMLMRFVDKFTEWFKYDTKTKVVPTTILNSPISVQTAFWDGLSEADGFFDKTNQLSIASINLLAENIGFKSRFNVVKDMFGMTLEEGGAEVIEKRVVEGYTGYVYDLTTHNHHFQAGIGRMIVHNTDSIFAIFPNVDENGNKLSGKQAIMTSIKTAMKASKDFKKFLKAPHDLEYEKTFWPFILLSKKRYCANKYEFDDQKCKMNSMGIILKRRDNAHIVKDIYGGILDLILNEQNVEKSINFLKTSLQDLIDGKVNLDKLVITKSLRSEYKTPDKIAHKVLAERMGERDPGNKPQINDRIPFVYIQVKDAKKTTLQGDRIEHPDFIRSNNLKPDYEFYITNQIMKPILQLYALALDKIDGRKKIPIESEMEMEVLYKKILKEKDNDIKKAKDKINDLKEAEVKRLLFDPFLVTLENKRKGNMMITDFFKMTC